MKAAGRKTNSAYELYGFIPKVVNGKHVAICKSCHRVLQNTAALRLQKHRNACNATRAASGDPVHLEIKKRTLKDEPALHIESISSHVKTEHSNMEYENENIDGNASNNNTIYEDTAEPCNNLYQDENPIPSPVTTQQHPSEPFESFHATITNTNTSANDEDLNYMEDELDVIQNLMPRSKASKQLQDELAKAETEYYRCKTAYFAKLTENCKIKRTLMLLESRKLQLEIERLSNES